LVPPETTRGFVRIHRGNRTVIDVARIEGIHDRPGGAPATDRAVYVAGGEFSLDGRTLEIGTMAVLKPGSQARIEARTDSKAMILGGEPLEGERYIYWNLVSSSRQRIEQAKDDWRNDRFDKVPGETDFIPLPD